MVCVVDQHDHHGDRHPGHRDRHRHVRHPAQRRSADAGHADPHLLARHAVRRRRRRLHGPRMSGLLDTATLAPDAVYVDVATSLRNLSIQRGSNNQSDALFHADTGQCVGLLDDRTRAFDPNSSTDIRPMRACQVVATWSGVAYTLFTGFVDSWTLDYPMFAKDATTTAHAVDGTTKLVNMNVTDNFVAQNTGARILALLDDSGWARTNTSIDAGRTVMPAHVGTVSAWQAMLEACDSEIGDLYVSAAGAMRFRNRDNIIAETRSNTSQATFGDAGVELHYHDIQISYDDQRIRNQITVAYNEAGGTVEVRDADSINDYGLHQFTLQASIADRNTAANLAWFLLHLYRTPFIRVDGITLKPRRDSTNLWPAVLARELGDLVTVKLTPPGGGSRISRDVFVRGIEYDIDADLDWTVRFTFSDASLFYDPFVLDTSLLDSTTDLLWF